MSPDALASHGWLAYLILALVVGFGGGFTFWLIGRVRLRREIHRLESELARAEVQSREQGRHATRLRTEQRTVANFVRLLPNAMRDLNREKVTDREVHEIVVRLAAAIFEPEQIALYRTRAGQNTDGAGNHLRLVGHKGLRDLPSDIRIIPFGDGKIGWVADHQMDMTVHDWTNPTRTEGVPPPDNHPTLSLDFVCPLVQYKGSRMETLGVLCLGRPTVRPKDEKPMLQMITNLGSVAISQVLNQEKLRNRANHDGLTGLMNKRHFMNQLGLLIDEVGRGGKAIPSIGVFIFDIDHFKRYNDTNGHLAGDELLKTISQVIRENVRPEDLPCRYGGEEFVVAMPDTDPDTALQVAERVRAAIESYRFALEESQPSGRLTISGGVAAYPADGISTTELISHSDQALYRAKGNGRNRVERYEGIRFGADDEDDDLVHDPDIVPVDEDPGTTGLESR